MQTSSKKAEISSSQIHTIPFGFLERVGDVKNYNVVNEIDVAKEDRLFMYIKKRNFADVSKH